MSGDRIDSMIINDEFFREKTVDLFVKFPHHSGTDLQKEVFLLLKEISRDTRHACAEAVLQGDYSDCHTGRDIANKVHALCMNAVR